MRPAVLSLLCCPRCGQRLRLEARRSDRDDIDRGWLVCPECPEAYPIIRGIPRFVPAAQYAVREDSNWTDISRLQRNVFNGQFEAEAALNACMGWEPSDFTGRIVLDLGVGSGEFAEAAARYGAEVVGVDFNATVDVARSRYRSLDNLHLIQADLSALPFGPNTFDAVYSMGILHYTAVPGEAFARAANAVKPSGTLAVVLNNQRGFARRSSASIRHVTTRLPLSVMLAVSALSVPLYFLCRMPLLGPLVRALCPVSTHADWRRRWLETFDRYTASYHWTFQPLEVTEWFQANGLTNVEIGRGLTLVRGQKGFGHRSTRCPPAPPRRHDNGTSIVSR